MTDAKEPTLTYHDWTHAPQNVHDEVKDGKSLNTHYQHLCEMLQKAGIFEKTLTNDYRLSEEGLKLWIEGITTNNNNNIALILFTLLRLGSAETNDLVTPRMPEWPDNLLFPPNLPTKIKEFQKFIKTVITPLRHYYVFPGEEFSELKKWWSSEEAAKIDNIIASLLKTEKESEEKKEELRTFYTAMELKTSKKQHKDSKDSPDDLSAVELHTPATQQKT